MIFPHAKDWANPSVHGVWVVQNNMDVCLNCHKASSTGTETAPACSSCHSIFPHIKDWAKKENHGVWVTTHGKGNCATQCHGADLKGGFSKISCNACHSIYPHPTTWISPEEHGAAAKGEGKATCQLCHGTDLKGGDAGVSCYQCHTVYPHDSNWGPPTNNHGTQAIGTGKNNCMPCHGTDLKGGISGISCNSCHSVYPHPDQWETPAGHAQYILTTLNGDKTTCQACHGADFKGGSTGVSCYQCHTVYPHDSNWGPLTNNHGPHAYGAGKNDCAACHGADFKGSGTAPSCYSCHADFPHTDPNWWTGTPGRSTNAHAIKFISESLANSPITCQACHGVNYDRAVGVAPQITCIGCHTNGITHQSVAGISWADGSQHGKFFSSHFTAISSNAFCQDCHGNFVNFTNTQTKTSLQTPPCTNCYSCYSCHWAYPHKKAETKTAGVMAAWEPVFKKDTSNNDCGTIVNFGHFNYLLSNPLFTDSSGRHPSFTNDPISIGAIKNTCGGTAGSCHFNGNRSLRTSSTSALCGTYCHNATMPHPPIRPPCSN